MIEWDSGATEQKFYVPKKHVSSVSNSILDFDLENVYKVLYPKRKSQAENVSKRINEHYKNSQRHVGRAFGPIEDNYQQYNWGISLAIEMGLQSDQTEMILVFYSRDVEGRVTLREFELIIILHTSFKNIRESSKKSKWRDLRSSWRIYAVKKNQYPFTVSKKQFLKILQINDIAFDVDLERLSRDMEYFDYEADYLHMLLLDDPVLRCEAPPPRKIPQYLNKTSYHLPIKSKIGKNISKVPEDDLNKDKFITEFRIRMAEEEQDQELNFENDAKMKKKIKKHEIVIKEQIEKRYASEMARHEQDYVDQSELNEIVRQIKFKRSESAKVEIAREKIEATKELLRSTSNIGDRSSSANMKLHFPKLLRQHSVAGGGRSNPPPADALSAPPLSPPLSALGGATGGSKPSSAKSKKSPRLMHAVSLDSSNRTTLPKNSDTDSWLKPRRVVNPPMSEVGRDNDTDEDDFAKLLQSDEEKNDIAAGTKSVQIISPRIDVEPLDSIAEDFSKSAKNEKQLSPRVQVEEERDSSVLKSTTLPALAKEEELIPLPEPKSKLPLSIGDISNTSTTNFVDREDVSSNPSIGDSTQIKSSDDEAMIPHEMTSPVDKTANVSDISYYNEHLLMSDEPDKVSQQITTVDDNYFPKESPRISPRYLEINDKVYQPETFPSLDLLTDMPFYYFTYCVPKTNGHLRIHIRHDDDGEYHGLFIHGFRPYSKAEEQGLLKIGDELIEINGVVVEAGSLEDVVTVLSSHLEDTIDITVRRFMIDFSRPRTPYVDVTFQDPSPRPLVIDETIEQPDYFPDLVELFELPYDIFCFDVPKTNGHLRIHIRHDDDGEYHGLFIHGFRPYSKAEEQGLLKIGDELIEINGIGVEGAMLEDLVAILAEDTEEDVVNLTVRRRQRLGKYEEFFSPLTRSPRHSPRPNQHVLSTFIMESLVRNSIPNYCSDDIEFKCDVDIIKLIVPKSSDGSLGCLVIHIDKNSTNGGVGTSGLYVHVCKPQTPAEKLLRVGDELLEINGYDLREKYMKDLMNVMSQLSELKEIEITVARRYRRAIQD